MKLTKVRVTNYKCVLDSEEFTLGDLTCLVGKNESGKTAVLEAIEKLRSVREERADFKSTDFPRVLGELDDEHERVVRAEFTLDDDEHRELVTVAGSDAAITGRVVVVTKGYSNQLAWDLPIDHRAAAAALIDGSALTATEKKALAEAATVQQTIKALKALPDPSPRQAAFLAELGAAFPEGSLTSEVTSRLNNWLPAFVYYSQYDRLPGRVQIERIAQLSQQGGLEDEQGAQVFRALLSMVGLDTDTILNTSQWEPLLAKFESVSLRTSRHIFKYWSQNTTLKVRFDIHAGRPGDPPPYNSGTVFETRIENTRHGASIRLDERSTGFIWFFSFLVWFAEIQKSFGDNLVVLLDEPGLTLHAKAQADLLRYIREELLSKYQVAYTTHSPFMVDASDLSSARTVEDATSDDDEVLGTKVGDKVLSADGDTLFPLRAALGYDISQTLFVGEHTLLVEGPSDLLYIQWASEQLRQRKRTALDPRWTVTPCGGIAKVSSFVSLFGGNGLHVAVLTDHGHGDRKTVRDLRESDLLRDGHLFTADAFTEHPSSGQGDTEDILGRAAYLALVNATYGLKSAHKLKDTRQSGGRAGVVAEVEAHFRSLPADVPEFRHYAPAAHLAANPGALDGAAGDAALDRFEKLFAAVNALL